MTIENTGIDTRIKKGAFIKGLILGVALLVLNIFSFYFITKMTTSLFVIIGAEFVFSILLPLAVAVFLIINLRRSIGGYWLFRQAVTGIFIIFLTSFALNTIGRDFIFAKLIEPEMAQKTSNALIIAKKAQLEKAGTNPTKIQHDIADMQKEFSVQKDQSVAKIVIGITLSVILVFAMAIIFGAIFKNQSPVYIVEPESDTIKQ